MIDLESAPQTCRIRVRPPEGDEARGSKLPRSSLDGAESEWLASREVDKKTWGGPAFSLMSRVKQSAVDRGGGQRHEAGRYCVGTAVAGVAPPGALVQVQRIELAPAWPERYSVLF